MVFKGHDKSQESSGMTSKTQTSKFLGKSRSGNSQYSTNSSLAGLDHLKFTEQDIQEEFLRLYTQLELLKEKNMRVGNRHIASKISAMQHAADKYELDVTESTAKKNCKINNMLCIVTEKLVISPPGEPEEVKNKRQSVSFAQIADKVCDEVVSTVNQCENSTDATTSKDSAMELKNRDHNNDRNGRVLKSGHAKTHSIVINLDDKSRFTEEVTV